MLSRRKELNFKAGQQSSRLDRAFKKKEEKA
jgi:hypothetical protein